MAWKIYHNPKCSKSRETLALLREQGVEPEIVEYLKQTPSAQDLKILVEALDVPVSAMVRVKEQGYKEAPFELTSEDQVVQHLVECPQLMERPIVLRGNKAVLGRPPENIKKLLE